MSPDKIFITVNGCRTSLQKLIDGDLPAATDVLVDNCPGLTAVIVKAGADKRGYSFAGVCYGGRWRITAGCRNFSLADARKHWGAGGESDRPDCLALVEKIASEIERLNSGTSSAAA